MCQPNQQACFHSSEGMQRFGFNHQVLDISMIPNEININYSQIFSVHCLKIDCDGSF